MLTVHFTPYWLAVACWLHTFARPTSSIVMDVTFTPHEAVHYRATIGAYCSLQAISLVLRNMAFARPTVLLIMHVVLTVHEAMHDRTFSSIRAGFHLIIAILWDVTFTRATVVLIIEIMLTLQETVHHRAAILANCT